MSKYDPLWAYIQKQGENSLALRFEEIKEITGFPLDHSFLQYKKELLIYGYEVEKISMKEQKVRIKKK